MNNTTAENKLCIACQQPIPVEARKCHHCLQIQTFPASLQHHPIVGGAFVLMVLAMMASIGYIIIQTGPRESGLSQMSAGAAHLRIETVGTDLKASCFAEISNNSPVIVDDPTLQAEFFDAQALLIDVHYEKHRVSLSPGLVAEGRVTGKTNAAPSQYASCRLKILSAT